MKKTFILILGLTYIGFCWGTSAANKLMSSYASVQQGLAHEVKAAWRVLPYFGQYTLISYDYLNVVTNSKNDIRGLIYSLNKQNLEEKPDYLNELVKQPAYHYAVKKPTPYQVLGAQGEGAGVM